MIVASTSRRPTGIWSLRGSEGTMRSDRHVRSVLETGEATPSVVLVKIVASVINNSISPSEATLTHGLSDRNDTRHGGGRLIIPSGRHIRCTPAAMTFAEHRPYIRLTAVTARNSCVIDIWRIHIGALIDPIIATHQSRNVRTQ
jgi:hypothetical protein